MSEQRPSALTSAKAAAQMRAMEADTLKCDLPWVVRACLFAQAAAVRECAHIVEQHPRLACHSTANEMRQLAADLDVAAKELG